MAKLTQKQFRRYLDRDGCCWHCGEAEAVAPHHRINRGMGGSKQLHKPSNIIVICSQFNGAMESDTASALAASQFGWKLPSYATPETQPVYNMNDGCWYLLTNDFGKELYEHRGDDGGASSL